MDSRLDDADPGDAVSTGSCLVRECSGMTSDVDRLRLRPPVCQHYLRVFR